MTQRNLRSSINRNVDLHLVDNDERINELPENVIPDNHSTSSASSERTNAASHKSLPLQRSEKIAMYAKLTGEQILEMHKLDVENEKENRRIAMENENRRLDMEYEKEMRMIENEKEFKLRKLELENKKNNNSALNENYNGNHFKSSFSNSQNLVPTKILNLVCNLNEN